MSEGTKSAATEQHVETFGAETDQVKFLSQVLTETFGNKFKIASYPLTGARIEEIRKELDHAMFEAWMEDKLDKKDAQWWNLFVKVLSLGDIDVAIGFVDSKPKHRNRG